MGYSRVELRWQSLSPGYIVQNQVSELASYADILAAHHLVYQTSVLS